MNQPTQAPCAIPGVTLLERSGRATLPADPFGGLRARDRVTQRLYRCANGWSLGARRGGRLHLAGDDTWEVFVLDPMGVIEGEPKGFVDEATLETAVRRLAGWFDTELVTWGDAAVSA